MYYNIVERQYGLSNAKRAMLGATCSCTTYKGWRVIPTESDEVKKKQNRL